PDLPVDHHSIPICFFSNATPTSALYTLSLHDALPIYGGPSVVLLDRPKGKARSQSHRRRHSSTKLGMGFDELERARRAAGDSGVDRKSTRLNSSHVKISYAVFGLKKKEAIATVDVLTV